MAKVRPSASGCSITTRGIEQHADRDEEQHGEGIAQRQGFLGGALDKGEPARIMPAKKAPSAMETPNR